MGVQMYRRVAMWVSDLGAHRWSEFRTRKLSNFEIETHHDDRRSTTSSATPSIGGLFNRGNSGSTLDMLWQDQQGSSSSSKSNTGSSWGSSSSSGSGSLATSLGSLGSNSYSSGSGIGTGSLATSLGSFGSSIGSGLNVNRGSGGGLSSLSSSLSSLASSLGGGRVGSTFLGQTGGSSVGGGGTVLNNMVRM